MTTEEQNQQVQQAEFADQIKKMKEMMDKSKGAIDKNFILAYIIDGDFPKVDGILSSMKIPDDADGNAWLAVNSRLFNFKILSLS